MDYYEDWSFECSMCGKPMSYRYCGMCFSCEQINDDVPDNPQLEECARCGDLTHDRDDIGKPLCLYCVRELTMQDDESEARR